LSLSLYVRIFRGKIMFCKIPVQITLIYYQQKYSYVLCYTNGSLTYLCLLILTNHICGVMVRVLASCMFDRDFDPR